MIRVFSSILSMSFSASVIILSVMIIRAIFKKSPKWINLILWCFVALRLICPFTIENPYSVQPKRAEVVYNVITSDKTVEEIKLPLQLPAPVTENDPASVYEGVRFEAPSLYSILSVIWIVGVIAMLIYVAVSYVRLFSRTRLAIKKKEKVYALSNASTPFVFGIFKPRIFIPADCKDENLSHIIAHELIHISRLDHLWKPLGFIVLSFHWFNPLVWLSYSLFCSDLEAACDERAIKGMSDSERADYAQALLDCSTKKSFISACPIAFGEKGIKERIKSVLNYKKPAVWITGAALILCALVAFFLLTDKKSEDTPTKDKDVNVITEKSTELNAPIPDRDTTHKFPEIPEDAVDYAFDIGFGIHSKHYKSGAAYGYVAMINSADIEKVKANETVELYYMEYYYYENTISPSEDDVKIIYPMFFALLRNTKTEEVTRLGAITDYTFKAKYKTSEMINKYGDECSAAIAEMYREYFHLDMGEEEQTVLAAYKAASNAASWFRVASILEHQKEYPSASDLYIEIDGRRYYKVNEFDSYEDFEDYLEGLFSRELCEEFLNSNNISYINRNGELYATLGIRGSNIHMGNEYYMVEKNSDAKYTVKVTVEVLGEDAVTVIGTEAFEFHYEFVDGKWVFTEFPEIR